MKNRKVKSATFGPYGHGCTCGNYRSKLVPDREKDINFGVFTCDGCDYYWEGPLFNSTCLEREEEIEEIEEIKKDEYCVIVCPNCHKSHNNILKFAYAFNCDSCGEEVEI